MASTGSKEEVQTQLYASLFVNYNPVVIPNPVTVSVGVVLVTAEFDEAKSTLDTNVWMQMSWNDSRLQWDKNQYNIDVLHIPPSQVWIPDIQLYNSVSLKTGDLGSSCIQSNMMVYPTGQVIWIPPCHYSSWCTKNPAQWKNAPHLCPMKFGSWDYDSSLFGLDYYRGQTGMDMSQFNDVTNWDIVSAPAQINENEYACCPGFIYLDITYNVTIQQKETLQPPTSHYNNRLPKTYYH